MITLSKSKINDPCHPPPPQPAVGRMGIAMWGTVSSQGSRKCDPRSPQPRCCAPTGFPVTVGLSFLACIRDLGQPLRPTRPPKCHQPWPTESCVGKCSVPKKGQTFIECLPRVLLLSYFVLTTILVHLSYCSEEEIKAQRGHKTCPQSHGEGTAGTGFIQVRLTPDRGSLCYPTGEPFSGDERFLACPLPFFPAHSEKQLILAITLEMYFANNF